MSSWRGARVGPTVLQWQAAGFRVVGVWLRAFSVHALTVGDRSWAYTKSLRP